MNNHSEYEEQDVTCRLCAGDMRAFDLIYKRYHKAVFHNILRLVRDSSATEDILQEVFIALWEKRETIDPRRSVLGWLFVVSYNRSVNELRKNLRQSLVQKEWPHPEIEAVNEMVLMDLQMEILEKAVARLPPQKRRVFELCKFLGKSYQETATELSISKHTVKEYLSDAISSIKEYIRQHPEHSTAITGIAVLGGLLAN